MSTQLITFPDKITGDTFSAAEATQIKTVVNNNKVELDKVLPTPFAALPALAWDGSNTYKTITADVTITLDAGTKTNGLIYIKNSGGSHVVTIKSPGNNTQTFTVPNGTTGIGFSTVGADYLFSQEDSIKSLMIAAAPSYDTDAVAYFTAVGASDVTMKDAYNAFVVSTKSGVNSYAKYRNILPFLSGSYKNAKAPATTCTTASAPTITDATGAVFNGTTNYLFSPIIPALSDECVAIAVKSVGNDKAVFGVNDDGNYKNYLFPKSNAGADVLVRMQTTGDYSVAGAGGVGRYVLNASKPAATGLLKIFKNGVSILSQTVTQAASTIPNAIGATNLGGAVGLKSDATIQFYLEAYSLTDAQIAQTDAAIAAFITATGRS